MIKETIMAMMSPSRRTSKAATNVDAQSLVYTCAVAAVATSADTTTRRHDHNHDDHDGHFNVDCDEATAMTTSSARVCRVEL